MADVEGLKEALGVLSGTLPQVPERLEALAQEASETQAAVEGFLASLDARLAEAAELVPRLGAALSVLSRLSGDETLRLDQDRDLGGVLEDPALALEDRVTHFNAGLAERAASEAHTALQGWDATKEERARMHEAAFTGAQVRFVAGRERVTQSTTETAQGLHVLRNTVEITRGALTEEVERFGATMEAQQTAAARDVDDVRKDLEALEAAVFTRVDRVRQAVRQDAEELVEATRERMEELRELVEKAVKQMTTALQALDARLGDDEDDAEQAREALSAQFEDLHEQLAPLRHALEGVREAAQAVGMVL
jgi:DNA repair exonuclease SbcCD ATPase subunit